MALTPAQIQSLINFNIPDNNQLLIRPDQVREVLNEILNYAVQVQEGGQTLQGVTNNGNVTTNPIAFQNGGFNINVQAGVATEDRDLELPDEDGVIATREWVAENAGGGGVDTGFPYSLPFAFGGGGGGGLGTWGYIGGTLSAQTDLQAALDAKADDVHGHDIDDVTGLQTALDGKQAAGSYAAASHTHSIANVTGLQTALDGKAASSHGHIIGDVTGLQAALDGKQAEGSYAAATHGHAIADVTGLQTALEGKQAAGSYAAASHTHALADVTGLVSALNAKESINNWTDYSASSTIVGWSSFTTKIIRTQQMYKKLLVQVHIEGTSNSATATFTLPVSLGADAVGIAPLLHCKDLGGAQVGYAQISGNTVTCGRYVAIDDASGFSTSGIKAIRGTFFIEID